MDKNHLPSGIHPLRGVMGLCHLLVTPEKEAVLIDTGLAGEPWFLSRLLARLDLKPSAIKAILLTHGHLDHAGNLSTFQKLTGAPVYAHALETLHVAGEYPYSGTNRWCGRLESAGRRLLRHRPGSVDFHFANGDELPFWGGLRVIHLPGHTGGHCGFYHKKSDLLFSGDLFASYFFNVHLPPPILNSFPLLIPDSLQKVLDLNPALILPNHYDFPNPALHRRRFASLARRKLSQPRGA